VEGWEDRLVDAGRQAVTAVTRTIFARGSVAACQFQASPFYEAVEAELAETPETESTKHRVLAAALAHCREIAEPSAQPPFVLARIKSALALLEAAADVQEPPLPVPEGAPRFRVVQGGRA
jgi:hypothetical protein